MKRKKQSFVKRVGYILWGHLIRFLVIGVLVVLDTSRVATYNGFSPVIHASDFLLSPSQWLTLILVGAMFDIFMMLWLLKEHVKIIVYNFLDIVDEESAEETRRKQLTDKEKKDLLKRHKHQFMMINASIPYLMMSLTMIFVFSFEVVERFYEYLSILIPFYTPYLYTLFSIQMKWVK